MSSTDVLDPRARSALLRIAGADRLLVALDVDGTIAELAPRPQDASVLDEALDAMRRLARVPRTTVAVLSGRARSQLEDLVPLGDLVVLAGSHGAERAGGPVLTPAQTRIRDRLVALVEDLAATVPGALAEPKPTGAALHVRLAEEQAGTAAILDLRRRAEAMPGVHVRTGKAVLELSAVPSGKGAALKAMRAECGAQSVLFVGDDDTDEEAFAMLGPEDLGVKVGDGTTLAAARVPGPRAVVALLDALVTARGRGAAEG